MSRQLPLTKQAPGKGQTDLLAMGEIYFALCKTVDSGVSLACWLLYKYGEHEQLAGKKVQPEHYTQMTRFRDDYLVVSYLSKWKGLQTGINLKAVALEGFTASEEKCRQTNERLRAAARGDYNPRVEPILLLAQRKIAEVLKGASYVEAFEMCGWGKGATSTLSGKYATLVRKIDPVKGRISVTSRAAPYLLVQLNTDPAWMAQLAKAEVVGPYSAVPRLCLEIVEGNRVTTVPKDATKDRTIAAEPTGNIFLQLGVGRLLRRLLWKRCGIDLDDQSKNQRAAKTGSQTGELATVDLRSASDTVSTELVYQLLPYEWSVLLDQLRSPKGTLDKQNWFKYEKFSSMGNGFTFELETLVFWALAVATATHHGCRGRVLAYGDDVILPSAIYNQYREVLDYCGFEVNTKKSYGSGPFRESCGSHYWDGIDVTPIYQKEALYEERRGENRVVLPEAYRCCNRLLRHAWRLGRSIWLDASLEPAWRAARRTLGLASRVRHVVPLGAEGDDGLLTLWEECWQYGTAVGHGLIKLPVLAFKPLRIRLSDHEQGSLLAYWLRQSARRGTSVDVEEEWNLLRNVDWNNVVKTALALSAAHSEPFAGKLVVRRRGNYVSRRRMYPIGTANVAWL